jgi:hypothetical protein
MNMPSSRFIARSLSLWKQEPRERVKKLHVGRLVAIVLVAALLAGLALLSQPAPDAAGTRSIPESATSR